MFRMWRRNGFCIVFIRDGGGGASLFLAGSRSPGGDDPREGHVELSGGTHANASTGATSRTPYEARSVRVACRSGRGCACECIRWGRKQSSLGATACAETYMRATVRATSCTGRPLRNCSCGQSASPAMAALATATSIAAARFGDGAKRRRGYLQNSGQKTRVQ